MPRFVNPPLQRHPALQPFSRDHYRGLVQAQHLIQSADGDAADRRKVLAEFLDAWEQEVKPHFADEERLLAELSDDADRRRLLEEHRRLREMVEEAHRQRRRVDPDAARLRKLGQFLDAHIRWEERELFTRIESTVDRERLSLLDQSTRQVEATRRRPRLRRDN